METFSEEQMVEGFKKWHAAVKENPENFTMTDENPEEYAKAQAKELVQFIKSE